MMQSVQVSGRFVDENGTPLVGECRFIPSVLWVDEGDESFPVAAPEVRLMNGRVMVYLTRTDQHDVPWHYTVICPAGRWTITVEQDGPVLLKDLLQHA